MTETKTPDAPTNNTAELERDLWQAVKIDPAGLQDEFLSLPVHTAHFANKHAQAIDTHLTAKAYTKKLFGLLAIKAREDIIAKGGKPTESQVEAAVLQMPQYEQAQEDEIAAEVNRERLKGHVEALRAKRDMLVQVGANYRAEMMRDPVIRERVASSRFIGGEG